VLLNQGNTSLDNKTHKIFLSIRYSQTSMIPVRCSALFRKESNLIVQRLQLRRQNLLEVTIVRMVNPLRVRGKVFENGRMITVRGCKDIGMGRSGCIMLRLRIEKEILGWGGLAVESLKTTSLLIFLSVFIFLWPLLSIDMHFQRG
jgi:hypothetical protein